MNDGIVEAAGILHMRNAQTPSSQKPRRIVTGANKRQSLVAYDIYLILRPCYKTLDAVGLYVLRSASKAVVIVIYSK
jgi:hypothetical protein